MDDAVTEIHKKKNKKKRSGRELDKMREETDAELQRDALRKKSGDIISCDITLPKNLEDLLSNWSIIKEENASNIVMFARRLYDITLSVLKDGCNFDTMEEDSIRKGLRKWIKIVEGFRICNRNQLSKYSITDSFEKFSVDTLYFLCQCNLLMILETAFPREIDNMMPGERDYKRLTTNRVMMFRYEEKCVINFNEDDVMVSLLKLSQVWSEIYLEDAIERFIDGIIIRVARMLTNFDRKFTSSTSDKNTIPDKEFFSDVSSMTSHMKTSFYISKDDRIKKETISMIGQSICEGYNINTVYEILADGFIKEMQFWNQETYGKTIKRLVYNISMRPGEEQRFARQNGGVFTKEATDVLELYRTDVQWDNIYERMLKSAENIPPNVPKPGSLYYEKDRDRGYISRIKNPTVLKIFDMLCNTECDLQWIANCVILEKDISYHYEKLSKVKYPIVIQMAGEFNVLNNRFMYKTINVEIALSVWVIIVVKLLKSKIFIDGATYNMSFLEEKIKTATSSSTRSKKESENDRIDAMIKKCERSVDAIEINVT